MPATSQARTDEMDCGSAAPYAERPYERRLHQNGRKILSVDLDASLVEKVDRMRGTKRRGLQIDQLLREALRSQTGEASMA